MKEQTKQTIELTEEDLKAAVCEWAAKRFGFQGDWTADIDCHEKFVGPQEWRAGFYATAKAKRVVSET